VEGELHDKLWYVNEDILVEHKMGLAGNQKMVKVDVLLAA
jgi:hypothetical protein